MQSKGNNIQRTTASESAKNKEEFNPMTEGLLNKIILSCSENNFF